MSTDIHPGVELTVIVRCCIFCMHQTLLKFIEMNVHIFFAWFSKEAVLPWRHLFTYGLLCLVKALDEET